jgi:uncharacterized membrane protein YgaE (UPF0421/DUF939 family)
VAEVTIGVAVGVFIADLLVLGIGSGWWQLAIIVALSMTAALLAAAVVPAAALRRPREQAALVVRTIASLLRAASESAVDGDLERAMDMLSNARTTEPLIRELQAAADEGMSVVASSPFRLRQRGHVRRMAELVEPMDRAMRNTRVLVRRVAVAAYHGEQLPRAYAVLCADLADATDEMAASLERNEMATGVRDALIRIGEGTAVVERVSDLSAVVALHRGGPAADHRSRRPRGHRCVATPSLSPPS